jgi:hypothetical protein
LRKDGYGYLGTTFFDKSNCPRFSKPDWAGGYIRRGDPLWRDQQAAYDIHEGVWAVMSGIADTIARIYKPHPTT